MSSIDPIAREGSLRQRVTASLRDAILTGQLKPGQKLVERELCTSLDISRTLLREALPQLQAEGLIRIVAHKGPSVASVDAEEAKEIYQVRRVLEGLAAQEFARCASDEQVKALREQLAALKRPEAASSLRSLLIAKAGFYSVLFEGCGNRVVSQVLTQLSNRMVLYKRLSLSVAGRLSNTINELEAVVSAIEARDPENARRLSEIHVSNAERNVLQKLSDDESEAKRDGSAPSR
ncbi:MAG TPA: GntR family transcriptional regulator [Gammaproteobacteria bacterium]|nr:GntR family transcriptional regulator [Gammaproteobacteria bacterium]